MALAKELRRTTAEGSVMDQESGRRSVLDILMSPAVSMTADATIAIIAEEGFDRVSVRSVAARLGVAPGTVQYRSPSRPRHCAH